MIFRVTALLLFSFTFGCHAQNNSKHEYSVVAIGFYNLENLFDTLNDPLKNDDDFTPAGSYKYGTGEYQSKMKNLSRVISEMATDVTQDGVAVLGVAEVENKKVLEDLVNQNSIAWRNYQVVHIEGPDERSIDCGLLYNPRYFTLKSSRSLPVVLSEGDKTRDILWVYGLLAGEPVHFFVNHWPSRRGGEEASRPKRAAAAAVARKVIDSLTAIDANVKCWVMGDLNDDPTNESVRKVLRAKCSEGEVKPGTMFNPFCTLYKNGIGTLAYRDSWNLFDQHIITPAFMNKEQSGFFFKNATVFNREYMMQKFGNFKGYPLRTYVGTEFMGGYSDHFPTYVVLLRRKK